MSERCPRCGAYVEEGDEIDHVVDGDCERVRLNREIDDLCRQLAQAQEREERLRRVVDQVEWVKPPDAHPDLGRWCPTCRSWEAYGHDLKCPYYGGRVNGILAAEPALLDGEKGGGGA